MTRGIGVIETVHSVVSSEQLLKQLKLHYKLPKRPECQLMVRGVNDTYKVQCPDGTIFAVRVSRHGWREESSIENECELLDILAGRGLSVPRPIKTSSSDWFFTISAPEGERYVSLTSWLTGSSLRRVKNKEGIEELGKLVASIHIFKKPEGLKVRPLGITQEICDFLPHVEKVLRFRKSDFDEYCFAVSIVNEILFKESLPMPRGICHGDIHAGNALMDGCGKVSLLDFDVFGSWYCCFDVASFTWSTELFNWDKNLKVLFLEGYLGHRALSDLEMKYLPFMELARDLWHIGTWANNAPELGCSWFFDDIFDERMSLLRRLVSKCDDGKWT